MLRNSMKIGSRMSDFVRRMADNVAQQHQLAHRVQTNALNDVYSIEHEAKLRQRVTLQSSIDGLEKELRKQIAQALRRSEDKVKVIFELAFEKYAEHQKRPFDQKKITQYNQLVDTCQKIRWEYIVHRQACGFTIQNYQIVTNLYKLPPKIVP